MAIAPATVQKRQNVNSSWEGLIIAMPVITSSGHRTPLRWPPLQNEDSFLGSISGVDLQ